MAAQEVTIYFKVKDAKYFRPRLLQELQSLSALRSAVFSSVWRKSHIISHQESCGKGKTVEALRDCMKILILESLHLFVVASSVP